MIGSTERAKVSCTGPRTWPQLTPVDITAPNVRLGGVGLFESFLEAADVPAAWNEGFRELFGFAPNDDRHGCLQDIHWPDGGWGYFPTYTLGNVYAGCLHKALRLDLPNLDAALAKGDTAPATEWLREGVQRHGGLREPRATIALACGFEPDEGPLLDYLDAKFSAIYGV